MLALPDPLAKLNVPSVIDFPVPTFPELTVPLPVTASVSEPTKFEKVVKLDPPTDVLQS